MNNRINNKILVTLNDHNTLSLWATNMTRKVADCVIDLSLNLNLTNLQKNQALKSLSLELIKIHRPESVIYTIKTASADQMSFAEDIMNRFREAGIQKHLGKEPQKKRNRIESEEKSNSVNEKKSDSINNNVNDIFSTSTIIKQISEAISKNLTANDQSKNKKQCIEEKNIIENSPKHRSASNNFVSLSSVFNTENNDNNNDNLNEDKNVSAKTPLTETDSSNCSSPINLTNLSSAFYTKDTEDNTIAEDTSFKMDLSNSTNDITPINLTSESKTENKENNTELNNNDDTETFLMKKFPSSDSFIIDRIPDLHITRSYEKILKKSLTRLDKLIPITNDMQDETDENNNGPKMPAIIPYSSTYNPNNFINFDNDLNNSTISIIEPDSTNESSLDNLIFNDTESEDEIFQYKNPIKPW